MGTGDLARLEDLVTQARTYADANRSERTRTLFTDNAASKLGL